MLCNKFTILALTVSLFQKRDNWVSIIVFFFIFRLTVLLAAYRYIFLSFNSLKACVSRPDRALTGVGAVAIISTILCIPSYVEHRIVKNYDNDTCPLNNHTNKFTSYQYKETQLSQSLSLRGTVFVLHGVIFKLIPCILLIVFSCLLIQQLRNALAASKKVRQCIVVSTDGTNNRRIHRRKCEKENRRTTLMLVIVCILFLITELPQGAVLLLAFLSKTGSQYYYQIYQQLGKLKTFFLFS